MKGGDKEDRGEPATRGGRKRKAVPELNSAQQFPSLGGTGPAVSLKVETVDAHKQHTKEGADDDEEEKERVRLAKKAFYKKKKKERAQRKKAKRAQEAKTEEQHQQPPKPKPEAEAAAAVALPPPSPAAPAAPAAPTTTVTKPVIRVKKVKTTLGELMVTGVPGKLEKKASTKKKKTPQVVTLPMFDEEGNRIVVLGRGAKTNGIVLRCGSKRRRVSTVKKALFRARVRAALQDTAATPESTSQLLDEFVRAARGMSRKERKQYAESLPPLLCQWGSCTASFGNTKAALEEFRSHLEAHARQQAQFVSSTNLLIIITMIDLLYVLHLTFQRRFPAMSMAGLHARGVHAAAESTYPRQTTRQVTAAGKRAALDGQESQRAEDRSSTDCTV